MLHSPPHTPSAQTIPSHPSRHEPLTMFLHTFLYLSVIGMPLLALANAEKAIFLGPAPVNLPQQSPSLADLHLDVLTPDDSLLRTHLAAVFPTDEQPRGAETWLLLDSLTEGQRYEVRVCWLATVRKRSGALADASFLLISPNLVPSHLTTPASL